MTGRVKSISNRDLKSFSDLRFSLEILLVTIWISIASYITENFPHHWVQYLLNQKSSDLTVTVPFLAKIFFKKLGDGINSVPGVSFPTLLTV